MLNQTRIRTTKTDIELNQQILIKLKEIERIINEILENSFRKAYYEYYGDDLTS